MFACFASFSTLSHPVSTIGENTITSTWYAIKERIASICFSCFWLAFSIIRPNPYCFAAASTLFVLAIRQELSAPSWENPTTIGRFSGSAGFPAHPPSRPSRMTASTIIAIFRISSPPVRFFFCPAHLCIIIDTNSGSRNPLLPGHIRRYAPRVPEHGHRKRERPDGRSPDRPRLRPQFAKIWSSVSWTTCLYSSCSWAGV